MTEINTANNAGSRAGQRQGAGQGPGGQASGGQSLQDQAARLTQQRSALQQQREQQQAQSSGPAVRLPGTSTGINTDNVIQNLLKTEKRRQQPIESRKNETLIELESYRLVKESLEGLSEPVTSLSSNRVWEGKLVESSNEEIVTASATTGAKPGKHTLVVDRLALNHQISSQGYESPDTVVGTGSFEITVGEQSPVKVTIDQSNNTLQGLRDAINNATEDIEATIIRTGEQERPHQLVLTSQKTGSPGRLTLSVDMRGGEVPDFRNKVDRPSDWRGVGPAEEREGPPTDTGASTAIVRVVGEYAGEEDKTYTFTAVQSGTVGGEGPLQLRWKSSTGESGVLDVDQFNYAPGEPIEFDDGLSLVISEGDIVVGDSFTVRARAERSSLLWWLSDEERSAAVTQPSRWQRQREFGKPNVSGPYRGEEEQRFTLTVEGSGQVGRAEDVAIRWRAEDGDSGTLRVGRGYKPGSRLALTDGITVSLNPGVLAEGDKATFRAIPEETSGAWWKSEEERHIPSRIMDVTRWVPAEEAERDEFVTQPEFPEEFGPRKSSTDVAISGTYTGDEGKVYTFTARRDGTIGTTKGLRIDWEDDQGNSGELRVGEAYRPGTPLPFDSGLAVSFGPGRVFGDDSFTVRTRTSTIQPPQDAKVRLGATELGGGLAITSADNELEDVIDGVTLNLVSTSEEPVTITVKGDTEKARETVLSFAEAYNEFAGLVNELTKYDPDTEQAGPLLGDSNLTSIRSTLSGHVVNPVEGLPETRNMLFTIGLKLNEEGLLDIEEETLRNKVDEDFGAVADLFRDQGTTENSAVDVVGIGKETRANAEGYPVNITRVPTRGVYETPPLREPIVLDERNHSFLISVDGRQSEPLELEPGVYTRAEYAQRLQDAITDDPRVGERRVRVMQEGPRLRIVSGNYGNRSSIAFDALAEGGRVGPGLSNGERIPGQDVAGTINGEPAEGFAQILRGNPDSTEVAGLRLFITLSGNQIDPEGPEASVKVTKGVASRIDSYLERITDPLSGELKRITDALRQEVEEYNDRIDSIDQRIDRRRRQLQGKFARLESELSSLRNQQRFVQAQLAGGGGGGGVPGLPGLPTG